MTGPVRPEDMRVSDGERRAVQERLSRAHDAGQLDLTEFDQRLRAVWAAHPVNGRRCSGRAAARTPGSPPAPRAQ